MAKTIRTLSEADHYKQIGIVRRASQSQQDVRSEDDNQGTKESRVYFEITSLTLNARDRYDAVIWELTLDEDANDGDFWDDTGGDAEIIIRDSSFVPELLTLYEGRIVGSTNTRNIPIIVLTTAGSGNAVDVVHVVGTESAWTCKRVTRGEDGTLIEWLDGGSNPLEYETVYESEDRVPRWVDSGGAVTHAIPLYQDVDGNYYIQFWKTCTFYDKEELTDVTFTITQNPPPACTFNVVRTRTFTTYRYFIDVMPMGNAESGLRLRIGTPVSLTDTCSILEEEGLFFDHPANSGLLPVIGT